MERISKGNQTMKRNILLLTRQEYRDLIENLERENEDLRAEVKRLTEFTTRTIIPNEILQAEVERLNSIIISGGAVVPDAKPFEE
jgi:hypothetical protein